MRTVLAALALLACCTPGWAQTPCGLPGVTVSICPPQPAPLQDVEVTLTNNSGETIFLGSNCVHGAIYAGAACSGNVAFQPLCIATVIIPIPDGGSRTQVWNQRDNGGQPVPLGTYSLKVQYSTVNLTFHSCCASFDIVAGSPASAYCTAGSSASGCTASLSAIGTASPSRPSGFTVTATDVEGNKNGLFFFGINGRQAVPWGNGSSFKCVVPPVRRGGLLPATGLLGTCGGTFSQDLNAHWCAVCPKPQHAPLAGQKLQVQLWYRDPRGTSNQASSLSNALEVDVCP